MYLEILEFRVVTYGHVMDGYFRYLVALNVTLQVLIFAILLFLWRSARISSHKIKLPQIFSPQKVTPL